MLIIDTHAHVYGNDDHNYPPVSHPIRPPGTSGAVSTLDKLAQQNAVTAVCMVQPGTFYGWDNRFICDVANAFSKQAAVICTLNPDDSCSYAMLKRYVRESDVRGLRSVPAADGHLTHSGVVELWKAAGEEQIVIDVLMNHDKTAELVHQLESFPRQPVVIDHCFITNSKLDHKAAVKSMLHLAKFPHAYAKLSFLPLGSKEDYPFRDMHESCKMIIAAYGPDRCIWGSNFPCELWTPKATYAQNLRLFTHELGLPSAARKAILGETARQLWFRDRLLRK